jgi:hypothetical protein
MSSVDNSITTNTGEEEGINETNTEDVVPDTATDTVADPSTSSKEVPNNDTNVNVSLEEKSDVTGIVIL